MANKRRVKMHYFVEIGRQAYWRAATINRPNEDLFSTLSMHFVTLRDVLLATRHNSAQGLSTDLLTALSLWQESQSQYAFNIVRDAKAAIPGSSSEQTH